MKRLEAIKSLISPCRHLADVGCDHGIISKYVLDNKLAELVTASDISPKSLKKAKKLLEGYEGVTFAEGDGLEAVTGMPDTVVLCGMGGNTIIHILSGYTGDAALILQPQRSAAELRRFLEENGYMLTADFVAEEKRKYYDVMCAKRGKMALNETQRLFGAFYFLPNPELKAKLVKLTAKLGAYKMTKKNAQILSAAQEVLKCQ